MVMSARTLSARRGICKNKSGTLFIETQCRMIGLPHTEESMMIRYVKPFRYNTVPQRDRRTDGRTDRIPISKSRVGIVVLTRIKNRPRRLLSISIYVFAVSRYANDHVSRYALNLSHHTCAYLPVGTLYLTIHSDSRSTRPQPA